MVSEEDKVPEFSSVCCWAMSPQEVARLQVKSAGSSPNNKSSSAMERSVTVLQTIESGNAKLQDQIRNEK